MRYGQAPASAELTLARIRLSPPAIGSPAPGWTPASTPVIPLTPLRHLARAKLTANAPMMTIGQALAMMTITPEQFIEMTKNILVLILGFS
jgi:hypothetical protein